MCIGCYLYCLTMKIVEHMFITRSELLSYLTHLSGFEQIYIINMQYLDNFIYNI